MNWWKRLYLWARITRADGPELLQARSGKWPGLRDDFLYDNSCCEICETRRELEVHHIYPVGFYPEWELEWWNLMTLCRRCHLIFGHLGLWVAWNPRIILDAETWRKR